MWNYSEEQKEKKKKETKSEESLQELRYTILKRNFIMEIPGEKKDRGTENMFKATMAENFPNLGKEVIIQTQEAQWIPNKLNLNKDALRHIINK